MAARCAANSATDCVIVVDAVADADGTGVGEGVGSAAVADWKSNIISKQEILITHESQNLPGRFFEHVACETKLTDILIGQGDRLL